MSVVKGDFGGPKADEGMMDMIPMGEALRNLVEDPFIENLTTGVFALVINTPNGGLYTLTNIDDDESTAALLKVIVDELEGGADGSPTGA